MTIILIFIAFKIPIYFFTFLFSFILFFVRGWVYLPLTCLCYLTFVYFVYFYFQFNYPSMGGRQQPKAKPRQDGDRLLSEAEGGAAAPRPDIERVSSLRVLGVILNDKLTAAAHVTALLSSSMLYAMRVLRSRGTPTTSLQDIYSAQQSSRASCTRHHASWSGMCSAADHVRLDSLLCRSKRLGYCRRDMPVISELFNTADDFFSSASKLTLTMSSSHIFLNIQSLHTSPVLALITSL